MIILPHKNPIELLDLKSRPVTKLVRVILKVMIWGDQISSVFTVSWTRTRLKVNRLMIDSTLRDHLRSTIGIDLIAPFILGT